jgi:hypothetical protein
LAQGQELTERKRKKHPYKKKKRKNKKTHLTHTGLLMEGTMAAELSVVCHLAVALPCFEAAVRIADGVSAIPIAATTKNPHLSFLRPSYFIGTGPDSAFSFALCFDLILLHSVQSTPD